MIKVPYKIIISSHASKEMLNHIDFLARVNEQAAKKLKKDIMKDIRSLSSMPQRNSFLWSDLVQPNKYRKMLSSKRYLIIYQIIEDTVFIDDIIDTRQNFEWLIF